MLRLVLASTPSTFSHARFGTFVSVDFPRIRQCTSGPRTTSVSKSLESASSAFLRAGDADDFMNVTKCVSPDRTGNGSASTMRRSSAAVRTNVATSKPNAR